MIIRNKRKLFLMLIMFVYNFTAFGSEKHENLIHNSKKYFELQQSFLDLRFGMFIHFNIPTYSTHDWPDPKLSPTVFNPSKLDCNQWADVALLANMKYGCITTKHHTGFCIWNTKTTDYSVMNSPLKRDVVKEYVDAFRKRGLKVFLYYSILDLHHNIRVGWTNRKQVQFIKNQLTELLTNYGEISCLVLDGWDAEWSRISYDDIPFEEIYKHVKKLQPNCLISEHNAGTYPTSELFYTDVKHYEQNAGQIISKETNQLPAQAGIPINKYWFWKQDFPTSKLVSAQEIVYNNLIPLNSAHCNFILNVAPNKDGLIDQNVIDELKKVGQIWNNNDKSDKLSVYKVPIITENLAKGAKMSSSWALGKRTSDLANDHNFLTCWVGSPDVNEHFIEVVFNKATKINALCFVESTDISRYDILPYSRIGSYELMYEINGSWHLIQTEQIKELTRFHRFETVTVNKVKVHFRNCMKGTGVSEIMIYNEKE